MGIQYSVTETQPHTHSLFILCQRSREEKKQKKIHKRKFYSTFINNEHTGEKVVQTLTTNNSKNVAGGKNTHFINKLSKVKSEDLYKQVWQAADSSLSPSLRGVSLWLSFKIDRLLFFKASWSTYTSRYFMNFLCIYFGRVKVFRTVCELDGANKT